jgi:hypothetical protein
MYKPLSRKRERGLYITRLHDSPQSHAGSWVELRP